MTDPNLSLFLVAALILLLTPGPSVLYIVARSIEQGARAGIVSALGMLVGGTVHIAAAAAGVSAILMTSSVAFSVLKYLGAAYLVYMGVQTLRSARHATHIASAPPMPLLRIFRQAVVVQVLNPKAALFFFAFLPQFVSPGRGPVSLQIIMLGLAYHAMGLVTDSGYAVAAGRLRGWLSRSAQTVRVQRQVAGATYIGLGILTAASGGRSK
jgi:threonine/homoserine/homoserine lactone efflux protein